MKKRTPSTDRPAARPERRPKASPSTAKRDEGVLESLGRAVSSPITEATEDDDLPQRTRPVGGSPRR